MKNKVLAEWELGWAAAIIDGEGCIYGSTFKRGKTRHTKLVLAVSNTDARMLVKLQEMFGGSIYYKSKGGPPNKPQWQWQLQSTKAGEVLARLLPYFVVKHDQAELGIALAATFSGYKGRTVVPEDVFVHRLELTAKLKSLKQSPMTLIQTKEQANG